MSVETIPFSELAKQTPDTFEAIVIMTKRARQVNAERLAKMELPAFMDDEEDDEKSYDREDLEGIDFDGIEKSTTFAIREMLTGDLSFRYKGETIEEPVEDGKTDSESDSDDSR